MVKTSLVEADFLAGRRLLLALFYPSQPGQVPFPVKAAFWLYYAESEEWRLVIATPLVDEQGSLKTYSQLQPVLFSIQPSDLSLQNIAVRSNSDPLVKAFRRALRMAPGSSDLRFPKGTVEGRTYIEGAYVYRLPPQAI